MSKTSDIKQKNTLSILRTIQQNGSISKNKIATICKLSPVTVHNLINELVELNICEESGEYVSNGGRKAAMYQINGGYGYMIGITLSRQQIKSTVYNMRLKEIYSREAECDMSDVRGCIEKMIDQINKVFAEAGTLNYLGIGIVVPGRANSEGAIITIPDSPIWNGVPLKSVISDSIKLPIYIDNDTNSLALASKWSGLASGLKNYIYLTTDEGIGVGVIINDEVFYGSNYYGCEIGHVSIDLNGILCKCGNRGCMQSYSSTDSILRRLTNISTTPISIDKGIERCLEKDEKVCKVFEDATQYISITIDNIIKIFDPEAVIIQNCWLDKLPEFFDLIQSNIFNNRLSDKWPRHQKFSLILNQRDDIIDSAAACLVLDRFYTETYE